MASAVTATAYSRPSAAGGERLLRGIGTRRGFSRRAVLLQRHREVQALLGRNQVIEIDRIIADVVSTQFDARPALLNLGEPGFFDITPWADRVQLINAKYVGIWELPVLGAVAPPTAVLIRPDGYAAWVGDLAQSGLAGVLTTWFGPPTAA